MLVRGRLIYVQLRKRLGKEKRPPELVPAAFTKSWLPTLDNLRNLLLRPTTEILNFFLYGLTLSGAAFALSTRMIVN